MPRVPLLTRKAPGLPRRRLCRRGAGVRSSTLNIRPQGAQDQALSPAVLTSRIAVGPRCGSHPGPSRPAGLRPLAPSSVCHGDHPDPRRPALIDDASQRSERGWVSSAGRPACPSRSWPSSLARASARSATSSVVALGGRTWTRSTVRPVRPPAASAGTPPAPPWRRSLTARWPPAGTGLVRSRAPGPTRLCQPGRRDRQRWLRLDTALGDDRVPGPPRALARMGRHPAHRAGCRDSPG
jgi:hypothetical protein